ncbi:2OG-Fe(II) oxygenase [Roseofilum sp. BLCC_M91]|uniref:2OG-Fe(II) oxygenase n=1 Tax=Roseofilum halophilum BLCC-M91 TaxID=3022259 RepID=A0ABT7BFC3_9CYAN|nr:2OG-Fe(II) oxygenase [Roseofilum halophilum]MDJ1177502.1 2OG-Fe(II) oxygenase [Roseofilum halophilum BLCC-M91]
MGDLQTEEYLLIEKFISEQKCESLLQDIYKYKERFGAKKISRNIKPIPLSYSVIDGLAVQSHLPQVQSLYERVNEFINQSTNQPLFPLASVQVGCNVNITEKGGTYRWHYDRNAVTALLYLNEVEGGEIEFYPNYRVTLPSGKFSPLQSWIDRVQQSPFIRYGFGQKVVVKPKPGLLLVMCGDKCLHSVRPVLGGGDRINIVMAYDVTNASYVVENQLNSYLYSSETVSASDPNYSPSRDTLKD